MLKSEHTVRECTVPSPFELGTEHSTYIMLRFSHFLRDIIYLWYYPFLVSACILYSHGSHISQFNILLLVIYHLA